MDASGSGSAPRGHMPNRNVGMSGYTPSSWVFENKQEARFKLTSLQSLPRDSPTRGLLRVFDTFLHEMNWPSSICTYTPGVADAAPDGSLMRSFGSNYSVGMTINKLQGQPDYMANSLFGIAFINQGNSARIPWTEVWAGKFFLKIMYYYCLIIS
jgi:hypothetical protein